MRLLCVRYCKSELNTLVSFRGDDGMPGGIRCYLYIFLASDCGNKMSDNCVFDYGVRDIEILS